MRVARPSADRARGAAAELIERFRVTGPPVPVERIVRALGIRVQYAPFEGDLSGMAAVKDGVLILGVNALHHPNRQRFTIAHELGHFQLHRALLEQEVHMDNGSLRRDARSAAGTEPAEVEANAFAAELLVPRALLEAELRGRDVDLEDDVLVSGLAKRFRVSEAAMRFRLQA